MKYYLDNMEVTKEIFGQRVNKKLAGDDITMVDDCDGDDPKIYLDTRFQLSFGTIKSELDRNISHADMIEFMTDRIEHNGFEQHGNLIILYFDEGVIILSEYRNLQKFYK